MQLDGQVDRRRKFLAYSDELSSALKKRDEVLGLIFVGSTADVARVDEWSDHDFFVVTRDGAAEGMRNDLSWLPRFETVMIAPRETDHGLKVVYQDGQVLEFAIFDNSELEMVSVNSYAIAYDKTDLTSRMIDIASASKTRKFNADIEFQLLLSQILIGVGRARRGELLSAGQFIHSFAMNHALGLVRAWIEPFTGKESDEDDLNRFRRVESQYPEIGKSLAALQQMDLEAAAKELLRVIRLLGCDELTDRQHSQIKVVVDRLGWEL